MSSPARSPCFFRRLKSRVSLGHRSARCAPDVHRRRNPCYGGIRSILVGPDPGHLPRLAAFERVLAAAFRNGIYYFYSAVGVTCGRQNRGDCNLVIIFYDILGAVQRFDTVSCFAFCRAAAVPETLRDPAGQGLPAEVCGGSGSRVRCPRRGYRVRLAP